jgi:hypothetical protein
MITVGDTQTFINEGRRDQPRPHPRRLVKELVQRVGREPGLAFWDASNEPDYNAAGAPAGSASRSDSRSPA